MSKANDGTTEVLAENYRNARELDVKVWATDTGEYVATEEMGESARSGNPYIALANLLDKMGGDRLDVEVTINGGGRDE